MTPPSNHRIVISLTVLLLLGTVALLFNFPRLWQTTNHRSIRQMPRNPMVSREPLLLDDLLIATETRVVPGEAEEMPYGLEVVMQTSSPVRPVAFVVETDGDIGRGRAVQFNHGKYLRYTRTKQGIPTDHTNWFAFEWETPMFTPDAPIIVSLSSKTPLALVGLRKVAYEWP
jgi:hypothetical protein